MNIYEEASHHQQNAKLHPFHSDHIDRSHSGGSSDQRNRKTQCSPRPRKHGGQTVLETKTRRPRTHEHTPANTDYRLLRTAETNLKWRQA